MASHNGANGAAPAPVHTAADLPPTGAEAPASVTVRARLRGYDVLVTLRGASGADVLPKTIAAIDWLGANGATPTAERGAPSSGKRRGPPPPPDPNAPSCPTHGSPMRQGARGWFCPRKDGDAYCNHTA